MTKMSPLFQCGKVLWSLLALAAGGEPSTVSSCRQFFAAFNDHVNERVKQAEAMVPSNVGDGVVNNAIPLVSLESIQPQQLSSTSGCYLLELSDQQAVVLDKLWTLTEQLFDRVDQEKHSSGNNDIVSDLRHQTLVQSDAAIEPQNVGYEYMEVNYLENNHPSLLLDLEKDSMATCRDSLNLLSALGSKLAVSLLQQNSETEKGTFDTLRQQCLVDHLVGGITKAPSLSNFQRLSRYMSAHDHAPTTQNLGSHCDWSMFTLVPVSRVPGLEIYDAASRTWVNPEVVAQTHLTTNGPSKHGNSHLVVAMTGKWLEIVSEGRLPSTIHRVVSPRGTQRRLSLPFFLRLRPCVLGAVEQVHLEAPEEIDRSMRILSRYLYETFGSEQEC